MHVLKKLIVYSMFDKILNNDKQYSEVKPYMTLKLNIKV